MTSKNRVLQRPPFKISNKATQHPNSRNSANPPRGNGKGSGGNSNQDGPSPWLEHPLDPTPGPYPTAGFVEYLRWMRSPSDPSSKDGTKIQLLTTAERGNYTERLKSLTERIRQIAGEQDCFQVTCPWRIRVVATAVQKLCSCRPSITWEFPIFPPAPCAA